MRRHVWLLLALLVMSACAREDPGRAALRLRLTQAAPLSKEDLGRLLDEVGRSIAGKTIRMEQNAVTRDLEEPQKAAVLGMLTDRAGAFDEGIRTEGGATWRVINEPADSPSAEIEATRRMSIDVNTFL